jgi:LacI family transcriptional regulator
MSTIFDIAREAGVSITTVSRALNGYSDVSEKTRERIIRIAQELNYYPSAAARSLQGKKTNTIAFAPVLRNHVEAEQFLKEFVGLLTLACFEHDLSLLATVAGTSKDATQIYRELAGTGRVDGIIVADIKPWDERIALLAEVGLPFVAFGRTTDYARLRYPLVDVDGAAGVRAVLGYLFGKGHRRIAYLSGPLDTSYALHRYSGYQQALHEQGLVEDQRLVAANLQEPEATSAAVARLFTLPVDERPTAVVASNDRLALQVLYTLAEQGLEAGGQPGQIAVTGFDDLPFAAYLRPPLTTVRQPIEAICNTLLDVLVAILKDKNGPVLPQPQHGIAQIGPRQYLVEPELIARDSA